MELDLANEELIPIIQIESNTICNDCGKNNPHWCSINNAVLLCPSCARTHKKFNKKISNIKSLEVDDWSKEEILILKIGGNDRFTQMIKSYNIPLTKDNKEYKYYTKAAQYYRDILIEEAKNGDIKNIVKPSLREGIEILYQDEYLNLFNKDEDNKKQKDNKENIKDDINNRENSENKTWVNRMIEKLEPDIEVPKEDNPSKGKQFLNNMMDAFNDVKERTKDIDFKSKFKRAGEFVQDKTEKIQNSGSFNRFMNAVSNSIDNIIQTTDKYFFKNENNNKVIPMYPNYINPNIMPQNNNINNIPNLNQINNQNNQPNLAINSTIYPVQNPPQNNINNDIKKKINQIEQDIKLNSAPIKKENNSNDNIGNNNSININHPSNYKEIKMGNDNKLKIENIENDKNNEREEKLDEEEKKNNIEKLDDNENDEDSSQIIMSNIPIHK